MGRPRNLREPDRRFSPSPSLLPLPYPYPYPYLPLSPSPSPSLSLRLSLLLSLSVALLLPAPASAEPVPHVVVLPPAAYGVALFPEELAVVHDAVVRRLEVQTDAKLRVVPATQIAEARRLVEQGRLREHGPVCAGGVSFADVAAVRWPGAVKASTSLGCGEGPCELTVQVLLPVEPGESFPSWEARAGRRPSVRDWVAAAGRLKRPRPVRGSTLVSLFSAQGTLNPEPIELGMLAASGPWARPIRERDLAPARPALEACRVPDFATPGGARLVVAVAPDGTPSRCHAYAWFGTDTGAELACFCRALSDLRFAPGKAGRRFEVTVAGRIERSIPVEGERWFATVAPHGTSGWTDAWGRLSPVAPLAAACFARAPEPRPARIRAGLDIAADGSVASARVDAEGALGECLGAALRTARLPCPPAGADPLELDIVGGKGEAEPFDLLGE